LVVERREINIRLIHSVLQPGEPLLDETLEFVARKSAPPRSPANAWPQMSPTASHIPLIR
jgi:hypothetical protein